MQLRVESFHDWFWMPMLLLLSFIALLFSKYRDQIKRCFLAIFSNREFISIVRDESQLSKNSSLVLNVFYLFSCSNFLFLFSINFLEIELSDLNLYLIITIFCFGYFLLKMILIYLIGEFFQEQTSSKLYISHSLLGNKVLGIIFFPLILLISYSQYFVDFFLYSSLSIWLFIITFKWYKGIKFGLSLPEVPKIYPFLYICSLEILPLFVFGKIFLMPLCKIVFN